MTKQIKIKSLAAALVICAAGIFSSCYYDYGIDPNTSNVVVTAYNNTYNFGAVTHYYLSDTVVKIGGSSITDAYDAQIVQNMRTNLNALGWVEETTTLTGPGVIVVRAGVTTSTVVVNNGYNYWGYYGYNWYYPPYNSYSYSYTTGTLIMLMSDYNAVDSTTAPVEWSGVLNAAVGQGTSTTTLITQGINQAFSQSPYLK